MWRSRLSFRPTPFATNHTALVRDCSSSASQTPASLLAILSSPDSVPLPDLLSSLLELSTNFPDQLPASSLDFIPSLYPAITTPLLEQFLSLLLSLVSLPGLPHILADTAIFELCFSLIPVVESRDILVLCLEFLGDLLEPEAAIADSLSRFGLLKLCIGVARDYRETDKNVYALATEVISLFLMVEGFCPECAISGILAHLCECILVDDMEIAPAAMFGLVNCCETVRKCQAFCRETHSNATLISAILRCLDCGVLVAEALSVLMDVTADGSYDFQSRWVSHGLI
jgi:hypothetical protein